MPPANVVQAQFPQGSRPIHNPHGSAPREVMRMVEWGLPALKAVQAATANAAELLRVTDVGRAEPGKAADLVLWERDPLDDVSGLLTPDVVMKAGAVVSGA